MERRLKTGPPQGVERLGCNRPRVGLGHPRTQGFRGGDAVRTAEGLLQPGEPCWGEADRVARGDVRRQQRLQPPSGIAREPAADRVAVDPQPTCHRLAVLGLPSRQPGEHGQAGRLMSVMFRL